MRQAKVLRLLRADARAWWWYRQLREMGRTAEAIRLERESVRSNVRFIRQNIGRQAITHRISVIEFIDRPHKRPFDLSPITNYTSSTMMVSNCHPGGFAAWVYCYAHRIGLKFTAKQYDLV